MKPLVSPAPELLQPFSHNKHLHSQRIVKPLLLSIHFAPCRCCSRWLAESIRAQRLSGRNIPRPIPRDIFLYHHHHHDLPTPAPTLVHYPRATVASIQDMLIPSSYHSACPSAHSAAAP
jgi:hypothetical protein